LLKRSQQESLVFQIRIHGRGGQGAVTAADLMSIAAFHSGRHALSFPSFGSERMGAPVTSFLRIDDREIELREPVLNPDMLIVLDSTLFHAIDVLAGLKADGRVLVNSRKSPEALGLGDAVQRLPAGHIVCVPATDLAMQHLKLPKPNTVLAGAVAAMRPDLFSLNALGRAIREVFPGRTGEMNVTAAQEAFTLVSGKAPAPAMEAATC
jgi:pyruvate ferredoxin oxidoreductase gamma subunit